MPCPGEPLLQPQGDPFLSAENLLQQVRHVLNAMNLDTSINRSILNRSTQLHKLFFFQEKPKTSQQQGAPIPDAKSVDSEASEATKEEGDDDNKVEEAEVSKKELVGQAAPLVDVSGKNSNKDKVNLFLLVLYYYHWFCKA